MPTNHERRNDVAVLEVLVRPDDPRRRCVLVDVLVDDFNAVRVFLLR